VSKDGSGKQIGGASNNTSNVFYNQALNTFYNWGCRSFADQLAVLEKPVKSYPFSHNCTVETAVASDISVQSEIFITDPPYGNAVNYDEITEFFIAWLRKNPPKEFADWTWDSRRALAIKGEDDYFRRGMIKAYRRMTELMPNNGMQVIMFTHQSGSIWADMANIIWASGLQVTAAWYVVTETDSTIRQGANVTGTILLVLRKRQADLESFRDDLAWEIEEAVKGQIEALVGLDKSLREQGSEGLYTDADLQMAGYAAALKVLTAYSKIDGKDMVIEAETPKVKGRASFVEELIAFAVQTAVQFLVPVGFEKDEWQKLAPVERYYLKMAEMENQGNNTLDNYQNFAKAFKIRQFSELMSENSKANSARLKLSTEFKGSLMSGAAEISSTPLRALLYGLWELSRDLDTEDVLLHLMENCPNYAQNRSLLAKMADYLAEKREGLKSTKTFHPEKEASNARVLAEGIRNQRL
jgi:putative DNA methylase